MTQLESKIKTQIKEYIESRGGYYAPVPQGVIGAKPGDPDMIICYKGRFIGMEGKTPTGKQRYLQKEREKQIIAAGGIYMIGKSVDDVKNIFDKIDSE